MSNRFSEMNRQPQRYGTHGLRGRRVCRRRLRDLLSRYAQSRRMLRNGRRVSEQVVSLADVEDHEESAFVFDEDSRDRLEFSWKVEDASKVPRSHIGDALAMTAEYILTRSQPYPGDELWVAEMRGVLNRFKVIIVWSTLHLRSDGSTHAS